MSVHNEADNAADAGSPSIWSRGIFGKFRRQESFLATFFVWNDVFRIFCDRGPLGVGSHSDLNIKFLTRR